MPKFEIKEYDPEKVFFTSDLHFGHENIIKYCNRPFDNVENMNKTLIDNWNETVPEDGIVFDLGDFALGGSSVWEDCAPKLRFSEHHLILGNHDLKNFRTGYSIFFSTVSMQQVILVDGVTIFLNHYPYLCFGGSYKEDKSVWNLFGHVHTTRNGVKGKDAMRIEKNLFPVQYDVGVDFNYFKPVSFIELQKYIMKNEF